jgi:hypothetical protein
MSASLTANEAEVWKLERSAAALDFSQRFTGTIARTATRSSAAGSIRATDRLGTTTSDSPTRVSADSPPSPTQRPAGDSRSPISSGILAGEVPGPDLLVAASQPQKTTPRPPVGRRALGSLSECPESVPANRGEPAPADGIASRTDHKPVAAEQPRCLGACTNNACLRLHASPIPLREEGERNRRLRVARFGEGNKICAASHRCCFVSNYAPEAANRTGNNLPARTLTKRHNTDGKPREKRCRRIRPKWSASDQETWEPAQELQRHQNPHLPPSDLLDGRVDDIDRCRHPRLVNLTDVEPRQQMVEERLRTTHMHCVPSHCRGVE